jgi:hypothetical protein
MIRTKLLIVVAIACSAISARGQRDVPVPARCTSQVNQKLYDLLSSGQRSTVDNVMVCGITLSSSRTQRGGPHGSHQILPLRVTMPNGDVRPVEVVTAPVNASVFAYGQAFFPSGGKFAAGVHDVHCSTHRGADNGWVVVNGVKHPASCNRY